MIGKVCSKRQSYVTPLCGVHPTDFLENGFPQFPPKWVVRRASSVVRRPQIREDGDRQYYYVGLSIAARRCSGRSRPDELALQPAATSTGRPRSRAPPRCAVTASFSPAQPLRPQSEFQILRIPQKGVCFAKAL